VRARRRSAHRPCRCPPLAGGHERSCPAPLSASFSSSGSVAAASQRSDPRRHRGRASLSRRCGSSHLRHISSACASVYRDELDAGQARVDHPVDRVRAAAADCRRP
jgi:hypothetical protein